MCRILFLGSAERKDALEEALSDGAFRTRFGLQDETEIELVRVTCYRDAWAFIVGGHTKYIATDMLEFDDTRITIVPIRPDDIDLILETTQEWFTATAKNTVINAVARYLRLAKNAVHN